MTAPDVTEQPWVRILLLGAVALAGHLAAAGPDIPIGYYGPPDPSHPIGGPVWQGASIAIDDANREGGCHGRPFRLIARWDENPWSGGAAAIIRMIYDQRVWAVIGSIDGETTHLAEQVVAKARLPLIDPASTDRSVNAAFVPWMFSVMPDDRRLLAPLAVELRNVKYVLLAATDHDSRVMAGEFIALMKTPGRPARRLEFERRSPRISEVAREAASLDVEAAVVLAGPLTSAVMVRQLRALRPDLRIYGGPAMGRRGFLEQAGASADGVRFPSPLGPDVFSNFFAQRYAARYGEKPDYSAFHAYDAVSLLVAAIRIAGPDHAAIRDALQNLSPWNGVSGEIVWDRLRRNSRQTRLATIHRGCVVPLEGGNP